MSKLGKRGERRRGNKTRSGERRLEELIQNWQESTPSRFPNHDFPYLIDVVLSSAWDEIYDVFGHGHDYDWALAADDELDYDEGELKPEMRYQDVCSRF